MAASVDVPSRLTAIAEAVTNGTLSREDRAWIHRRLEVGTRWVTWISLGGAVLVTGVATLSGELGDAMPWYGLLALSVGLFVTLPALVWWRAHRKIARVLADPGILNGTVAEVRSYMMKGGKFWLLVVSVPWPDGPRHHQGGSIRERPGLQVGDSVPCLASRRPDKSELLLLTTDDGPLPTRIVSGPSGS